MAQPLPTILYYKRIFSKYNANNEVPGSYDYDLFIYSANTETTTVITKMYVKISMHIVVRNEREM